MRLPILCFLLVLTACGARTTPAPASVPALQRSAASLGQTQACTADLVVQATPAGGNAVTFTVSAWMDQADQVRVRMTKLGADFLDARLDPHGHIRAVLVRSRLGVDTTFEELQAASQKLAAERKTNFDPSRLDLLQQVRTLISEVKSGPIPNLPWQASDRHPGALSGAQGGTMVHVLPQPPGISEKWIYQDQDELAHIVYSKYQNMDGVIRPERLRVTLAGGTQLSVRLRSLDQVPGLSPDRLSVWWPEDIQAMNADQFLRALVDAQ